MRSLGLGTALVVCATFGGLSAGCKSPSQLILGFATDLSAPNAIDEVHMNAYDAAGQLISPYVWKLPGVRDKTDRLPGSFTLYDGAGGEPIVRVELIGLKGGVPIVTRTNTLGLLTEDSLFFRMTLVERCSGMVCSDGESCVEGKCKNNLVNLVSLRSYQPGAEAFVQCSSGSKLMDTGTHEPMALDGSGFCAADQWCGDATCYRNQGQGLLWCSPPSYTCNGVDGYEGCIIGKCQTELAGCYGADWRRGHYAGPCADYASCKAACACDASCISACDAERPTACSACIDGSGGVTGCLATAEAACKEPACTPIAGGPDAGMPPTDGGAGPPPDAGMSALTGLKMIAQGTYTIGCDPGVTTGCNAEDGPPHQVTIGGIYLETLEVSQADYEACASANACNRPVAPEYMPLATPTLPVTSVVWDDAFKYCQWKGTQRGGQGRLPSEAEWEIAAHGVAGETMPGSDYPWGNVVPVNCTLAEWIGCDPSMAVPGGTHPAGMSVLGFQDLAGNVAEWVNDWHDSSQYANDAAKGVVMNPMGGPPNGIKVVRGGSWFSNIYEIRASSRQTGDPTVGLNSLGFRCAFLPM